MSKGTPIRTVRIPDEVWRPALERAKREGRSLSELMQTAVARYARGEPAPPGVDTSTPATRDEGSTPPNEPEEAP